MYTLTPRISAQSTYLKFRKRQFCLFEGRFYFTQLLNEVFMISRIIKAEVGVISLSLRLWLITLAEILSQKLNLIIVLLYIEQNQKKVTFLILHWRQARQSEQTRHVSCTAVIHDMITHDLECPWHDYCIICSYNVTGTGFESWLYVFSQSEKR